MPSRKKIAPKDAPLKKTVARSSRFERFTRSAKRGTPRPQGRNSTAR